MFAVRIADFTLCFVAGLWSTGIELLRSCCLFMRATALSPCVKLQDAFDAFLMTAQYQNLWRTAALFVFFRKKCFERKTIISLCRNIPAKPAGIKKEKDIPRLPEN